MEQRVTRFFSTKKAEKTGDRTFKFLISDESIDRHGTVIKADGWQLKNYEQNPIVAYQHDTFMSDPDVIVGKALNVWVQDKGLWAEAEFEPKGTNQIADKLVNKIDFGSIRSVSVGFIPLQASYGTLAAGEDPNVLYFRSQDLLEFSIVHIPSNPNAVLSKSLEEFISKVKKEIPDAEDEIIPIPQEVPITDDEEKPVESKKTHEYTGRLLNLRLKSLKTL